MILPFMTLATTLAVAFGAPYPGATIDRTPGPRFCSNRYTLVTADPIETVAAFYQRQAAAAKVPSLDDSAAKLSDYRTLVFVREPKFLSVVLSRAGGRTTARVAFHVSARGAC